MKLFGREIALPRRQKAAALQTITAPNSFWGYVRESFSGAWQSGITVSRDETLSYFAVYSCISLISQDISKMDIKLMQELENGVNVEATSPAFSPVLRKPNHYQTRIKFIENWVTSKLIFGNTYVLKERDARGIVVAMYILDPLRVTPLVSDTGDVYYQLQSDYLAQTPSAVTVPASEIIHDVGTTLWHPLLGVSPLFACGLAATQGKAIQTNSSKLFGNMSRPSGILTAPGAISNDTAQRLKDQWELNYSGNNVGKTAVLGDGLTYLPMTITPEDAQLIEQLKMSAEVVCSAFHVPVHMIMGPPPAYNNIEALNQQYYSQALQSIIESIELLLEEGLGLYPNYEAEFDLDGLLRMDTATRYKAHSEAITGGWFAPNEARKKENLVPVKGGDTPYLQQQQFSLAALAERDANKPFATPAPAAPGASATAPASAPGASSGPTPATPPVKALGVSEQGPEMIAPLPTTYENDILSAVLLIKRSPLHAQIKALENAA